MKLRFTGNRAFILGGSCEMAIALSIAMIPLGIRPLLTFRSDDGRRRIEKGLSQFEGEYDVLLLDLAKPNITGQAGSSLGKGLDYMVDFAQGDLEGLVASVANKKVRTYFDTNISLRHEVIQWAARSMLVNKRGRMVYVSSVAAAHTNPGQGFYAACKQATEALYKSVGVEMASRGITTVALRPGYVDAGRGKRYLESGVDHSSEKRVTKIFSVREIVEKILFLLSDNAKEFNATVVGMG